MQKWHCRNTKPMLQAMCASASFADNIVDNSDKPYVLFAIMKEGFLW
jgi:hypothetical protein